MLRGSKAEPLRGKAAHLDNSRLQKEYAKVCLECTGVSAFLAEIGKVRSSRSKARPRRSKALHFAERLQKVSTKEWTEVRLDRAGASGSRF